MSTSENIDGSASGGTTQVVEGAQGLKVPLPLLIMLLMVLVILSIFDILKKSYDVHEEANYRVAKAALEITLSRTQSGLNSIALKVAAENRGFDEALPEVFFTGGESAAQDLSDRTLFLAFDRERKLIKARVGQRNLDGASMAVLATQPAVSDLFSLSARSNRQAQPLLVTVDNLAFILSDPQQLEGPPAGNGATHVAVALPVKDLLFDELEKYEVFGSGQLRRYLERKSDLNSLTEMIVSLQKRDYAEFHFKAVAQIVIVLVAFVISVMIGHHIDRKNDALRQSRDAISAREREAQRLRQAAERASEAKSRFIQRMSHELRTPLNAVIGFSEVIVKEKLGPVANEYRDCANEIHLSGNHLLNQINDILDFSRIESGSEVVVEDEIDLHELARSVSQQYVTTASKAGVTLQMDLPSSLPPLFSDTDKVKKVLGHLLGNAVKFTPQGGRVTLSVRSETNGDCLFEVIDSGIGMSAEDQEKALGLFNQVDVNLSRRSEGSGLGLPLSKSIVELLGGSLQLHSSPGAGTTVKVHLPSRPVTAKSAA